MLRVKSLACVGRHLDCDGFEEYAKSNEGDDRYEMFDFSSNRIAVQGTRFLVNMASKFQSSLQIVKLHKNQLGNDGAAALGPLLESPKLREMHLSHNQIEDEGARALLRSVRAGLSSRTETIFMRLEHNRISSPASVVLEELTRADFCCRYDEKCTRHRCSRGRLCHLPLIWKQENATSVMKDKSELEGLSPSRGTKGGGKPPPSRRSPSRGYRGSGHRRSRSRRQRSPYRRRRSPSRRRRSPSRRRRSPSQHRHSPARVQGRAARRSPSYGRRRPVGRRSPSRRQRPSNSRRRSRSLRGSPPRPGAQRPRSGSGPIMSRSRSSSKAKAGPSPTSKPDRPPSPARSVSGSGKQIYGRWRAQGQDGARPPPISVALTPSPARSLSDD